ncbi:MAG: hypothetical protein HAW66_07960 [Shewanella sp.]|nr:hypothetical protein [Shewanella sp.]
MRLLSILFTTSALLLSLPAFSHGDGHSEQPVLSTNGAVSVAVKAAKKMSFKDMGFAIGKLDKSWGELSSDKFELVESSKRGYVIAAINETTKERLIFTVSQAGELLDVAKKEAFAKKHGHSH